MHVKVLEREGTDHLPAILAELNVRHAETKRRNPRGFLDQFELERSNNSPILTACSPPPIKSKRKPRRKP